MGCIDTKQQTKQLRKPNEQTNQEDNIQKPQKHKDPKPQDDINENRKKTNEEPGREQHHLGQGSAPSKIVKSRQFNRAPHEIDPMDIGVAVGQNPPKVSAPGPVSNVLNVEIGDYDPNQQKEPTRNELSPVKLVDDYNEDGQVVHVERNASFSPSIRGVNFHVQIS